MLLISAASRGKLPRFSWLFCRLVEQMNMSALQPGAEEFFNLKRR